ncbi:hypothetical protein ACFLWZ_02655 [Chloroflexota bacterium]
MEKNRGNNLSVSLVWLLIITAMLVAFGGCRCGNLDRIIIENQSDQALTIYAGTSYRVGDLDPGQQITINKDPALGPLHITALNTQGEVVFDKEYSYSSDLIQIKSREYKAIIPPLQNN